MTRANSTAQEPFGRSRGYYTTPAPRVPQSSQPSGSETKRSDTTSTPTAPNNTARSRASIKGESETRGPYCLQAGTPPPRTDRGEPTNVPTPETGSGSQTNTVGTCVGSPGGESTL